MATETVFFNVGGRKYEVSRSLLNLYPDTMLCRSASEQWQEDPESEIFIERNGVVFQYVLDYLCDASVSLPPTIPKSTLVKELQYFGLNSVDESTIDDSLTRGLQVAHTMKSFSEDIDRMSQDLDFALFTKKCFSHFVMNGEMHGSIYKSEQTVRFSAGRVNDDQFFELANKIVKVNDWQNRCNIFMCKVGLKLTSCSIKSCYPSTPNKRWYEVYEVQLELADSEA